MGNVPGKVDFSEEVNLSQFNLLRSVGRGSFGKVRIVERKDTKRLFALKYISKKDCIRMDALRNVFRERNILEAVDHPFICNLRFAFQDDDYMYMALDLMLGGDLRFHLLRKPYFSEDAIRMWISEIACAVDYLHGKGIVHRDIKPDNILLDEYGHAHLTDFNIATHAERSRPLTSESGTYVYMAPEMLTRKGYLHSVDWWALGVVFYECIYGKRPFDGATNEELRYSIAKKVIRLSQRGRKGRTISSACLSAIDGFLQRDSSKRLGAGAAPAEEYLVVWEEGQRGLAGIQAHPFFADLDWYRLERKELQPAYVPDSNAANFDVAYDLEELLLEQQPLEAKPRKKGPNGKTGAAGGGLSKEMELIERRFRNFDYMLYERYDGFVDPVRRCVGEPPEWVKCVDPDPPTPRSSSGSSSSAGSREGSTMVSSSIGVRGKEASTATSQEQSGCQDRYASQGRRKWFFNNRAGGEDAMSEEHRETKAQNLAKRRASAVAISRMGGHRSNQGPPGTPEQGLNGGGAGIEPANASAWYHPTEASEEAQQQHPSEVQDVVRAW